jgi:4-diphosphocytidyl-2-C-methyl-D-erythritol kinase
VLGSDVPFFLRVGTALVSGRGEVLEPLPDASHTQIVIAWKDEEHRASKTASMYAALRPELFTDGAATEALAARMRAGDVFREQDMFNVFERVINPKGNAPGWRPDGSGSKGHLCGSGPAWVFLPRTQADVEIMTIGIPLVLGMRAAGTHTISAAEATAVEVLD